MVGLSRTVTLDSAYLIIPDHDQLSLFATQHVFTQKNIWSVFIPSTIMRLFNLVMIGLEMSEKIVSVRP